MTEDEARRWNTIFDILGKLEEKLDLVLEEPKHNPPPEPWPWQNDWHTSPNMTPSPADWWKGPVDQDTLDSQCLHMQCPSCGGSGMTVAGTPCVHAISCFCPRCTPQC